MFFIKDIIPNHIICGNCDARLQFAPNKFQIIEYICKCNYSFITNKLAKIVINKNRDYLYFNQELNNCGYYINAEKCFLRQMDVELIFEDYIEYIKYFEKIKKRMNLI